MHIFSFSSKKLFVTFDGSSYFSINRFDHNISYDFFHVNSVYKLFVLNRTVESDTLDSFFLFYSDSLYLPWYLDISENEI